MEYANAAITIGGKIKRSDVEKLAQAIAADGAALDWSDRLNEAAAIFEIEECAKAKRLLDLCNADHPWGQYEAIQAVCRELGLIHKAECEAGGEWHPHLEFYDPARQPKESTQTGNPVTQEWAITEIGRGPMIDAEDIQKHLDAGTLADELALMTAVHKFPWLIEIVEDEADLTAVTRDIAEGPQ